MMNWGKKKKQPSSSSSSSRPVSISKLFPVSWLSKLKQNCSNSRTEQEKMRPKGNQDLPMDSMLHPASFLRGGSEATLMSFWNDSHAEPEPPFPSRRSTKPASREQEETKKSSSENLGHGDAYDTGKVQSSREVNPRALSENKLWELQREAARLAKLEQPKEWQKLKHLKIRETGGRSETQKESQAQSLHMSRESAAAADHRRRITNQRSKVRAYSPRSEACKIKAIEDMKRARVRMKKKARGGAELESFATVKRSSNPGQDFRDSMVEMIREKRICHPEELEELLACYLSLNCDQYHDLIIKVFREVWFELKLILLGDNSSPEMQD